jgi:DegV family protein with EDD domain
MSVRVVTDSAAYLAPELAKELGIGLVPFHIHVGGQAYLDGVDIDTAEYYRLLEENHHLPSEQHVEISVSPPTVEEYYRTYSQLAESSNEILSIHPPEALTPSVNNARQAARMLLGRCQIIVLDSQTISLGQGILVKAALDAAREEKSFEEIVRIVRGLVPRIYIVFFSDNLEYLKRGGRIGEAQALLGTMLGIKPFLTLEDGEIQPMEKVRTREEALEKLAEFVSEFDSIEQLAIIRGMHKQSDEIDFLIERLHTFFQEVDISIIHYGPVLASHIGPGNLGVIVYESLEFED